MELPTGRQRTSKPASRDVARAAVAAAVTSEPAVLAAYLFGSVARGAAGPLSDLDVAVLLSELADDDGDVVGRIGDALCRRLGTDRIDVISLRTSPVPLRYRAVREGILVFCRDPAVRERFTNRSSDQWHSSFCSGVSTSAATGRSGLLRLRSN